MSKIWICQEKTAEVPFFLERQGINIYSMEELCYYLYQNCEMLEETFFDERLLNWLEKELEQAELCRELQKGIEGEKSGFWCMERILWESGYYSRQEIEKVHETVTRIIQAQPEERGKLRADRMFLEGKYKGAVQKYRQLLKQGVPDKELESRIWHNMGTAYARQFLFVPAAECFEKAYTLGRCEESRQQYLLACACAEGMYPEEEAEMPDQEGLRQVREKEGVARYEDEVFQRLEQMVQEYMRSE